MKKMTLASEQHRDAQLIAGLDGIPIAKTAARLHHSTDAVGRRKPHRVIKRKEAITGQNGTLCTISRGLQGQTG